MDQITLTPDLERFASEAVASGRFRNVGEVVRAGVDMLRRHEAARRELLASVLAAEAEAERDGWLTGDEVAARVRATITHRTTPPV